MGAENYAQNTIDFNIYEEIIAPFILRSTQIKTQPNWSEIEKTILEKV